MPSTTTTSNPPLLRQLGVISATALVVSNMIGAGIFTSTGFMAGDLGSPSVIMWTWVVGALCALCGALCYSELGINMPSSGGEYVYLTRAYGPTWGFMTGWVSFFAGFSAPIASVALGFADYLAHFFPILHQENSHSFFSFGPAQILACSLVLVFSVINVFGVQRAARLQNVLTTAKIIILISFIVMALAVGTGHWSNFSQNAVRTSTHPISSQFFLSLFWVYVAYSGWNAATYVAEELKNPSRTLPIALTVGTILVAVLYLALNAIFIYAVPLESMKGELAVGELAASHLFGPRIAGIFSALIALSLMSTVNAMVTIGPRVYYAMAKNRAFIPAAAKVHPKWRTPVVAIAAQCVCTMLMTLTPFPQLIKYIGFTLNIFAVLSVVSLMIFRRRPGWQKLPVVSFAYPLIPVLFAVIGIWMTIQSLPQETNVALAGIATLATGALVYHFTLRPRETAAVSSVETY